MRQFEWKKDHMYWVRYKFAPRTLTIARPYTIREGKVMDWSMGWSFGYTAPVKHDELEILEEIPFPEGYGPR